MSKIILILQSRYGQYHFARLKAAREYLAKFSVEVVGCQISEVNQYLWNADDSIVSQIVTIIPGSDYRDLNKKIIWVETIRTLDTIQPAAVVINGYSFAEAKASLYWCKKNGKAAILVSDSQERDAKRNWLKEKLKSVIVKMFDSAHVSGASSKRYLIKLGMAPDKIFTGYDAVDNDYFSTQADSVRQDADDYRKKNDLPEKFFLSSSRFIPCKNLSRMLDAYAKYFCSVESPWDLVLLGDGQLRPEVEKKIKDLRLTEHVVLPGFRQIKELPVYYSLASCLLLASTSETWGLVVNEAMASGLPVLVSNMCGCQEDLVDEGCNGFTFDPLNLGDMTKKMIQISSCECNLEKMGERSREIISNWGCENFSEKLWKAVNLAIELPRTRKTVFDHALLWGLSRI